MLLDINTNQFYFTIQLIKKHSEATILHHEGIIDAEFPHYAANRPYPKDEVIHEDYSFKTRLEDKLVTALPRQLLSALTNHEHTLAGYQVNRL